jgi:hypothetical protein
MRAGVIAVAVLIAVAVVVPTVAMSHGGEDDVDGTVTLAPADGPNGQYATVDEGELRVDFDRLNDDAVTTADDVVNITSTVNETIEVWVGVDAGQAVTVYESDDPDAELAANRTRRLAPGESLFVGFEMDSTREVPESARLSIGISDPEGEDTAEREDSRTDGGPLTAVDRTADAAVGVEVFLDGREVDPDEVTVTELAEVPTGGPDGEPEARVDRGTVLLSEPDGILTAKGTTLVAEPGETVTFTASRSSVRTTPAVDPERRAVSPVDIDAPERFRRQTATVRFRLPRRALADADPTRARVGRLTPSGWQLLPTRVVEAGDRSVVLEARTVGFSVFAVFRAPQVAYTWTLPNGTTVQGSELTTSFEEPGVRTATLTVADAEGRSDRANQQVVVNDEPSVGIAGASNASAGEPTTLRADVTNEFGNTTVTWTLPGGATRTGRTVTDTFGAGDGVRVAVEDEFGATGTARTVVDAGALQPPVASLRAVDGPVAVPLAVVLSGLVTALVFGLARSRLPSAVGRSLVAPVRAIPARLVDDSPRVTAVATPTWHPDGGYVELAELRVQAPRGRLDTVEVTISDDAGEMVVRKSIDVGGGSAYVASPERIRAYGEVALSGESTYTVRVDATDELDRVGSVHRTQQLSEPTPRSSDAA